MYSVRILPPAARYFKKIKDRRLKQLYKEAIDNLAADPFKGTQKTGDLRGIWGYDLLQQNKLRARLYCFPGS